MWQISELHPLAGTPLHVAYPIFAPFKSCLGNYPNLGYNPDEEKAAINTESQRNSVDINGRTVMVRPKHKAKSPRKV